MGGVEKGRFVALLLSFVVGVVCVGEVGVTGLYQDDDFRYCDVRLMRGDKAGSCYGQCLGTELAWPGLDWR
jgi:hypothetical protein